MPIFLKCIWNEILPPFFFLEYENWWYKKYFHGKINVLVPRELILKSDESLAFHTKILDKGLGSNLGGRDVIRVFWQQRLFSASLILQENSAKFESNYFY